MRNTFSISVIILCLTHQLYAQDWHTLDKSDCSITYPSNWELNESGLMGITFGLFSPQTSTEDLFRENVNLVVQDLTGMGIDLDQFTEISTNQISSMFTNSIIQLNERVGDYQKLIYEGEQAPFNLSFEQYYWVKNDKAYILTFTTETEQFSNYQEIGEQIMNSFQIK